MTSYLRLFPLNTVLFPGATLSLRIFEDRYKEMLRECLSADRRFGVCLIKKGEEVGGEAEPYRVGTVARIEAIGAPTRGGLPIEVIGERRFRIVRLDRTKAFLGAQVNPFDDVESNLPPSDFVRYAVKAGKDFVSLLLASRGVWKAGLGVPDDPVALSYFLGLAATDAALRDKQKLLETESLLQRLQAGVALLEQESKQLRAAIMRSGPGLQESRFSTN
jgi:uncharacterized protein